MIEVIKKDDITVTVEKFVNRTTETEWTLETLEHAIAQCNLEIDNSATRKNEYVSIKEKAENLGVIHPKDVIMVDPAILADEETDE